MLPLPELDGKAELYIPHKIRILRLEISGPDTCSEYEAETLGIPEELMIDKFAQQTVIVAHRVLSENQS